MECEISKRDEYLFRKLGSGPAPFARIHGWMNERIGAKDPSAVVRNRASAVSMNAARLRLSKLNRAGYVQSRLYKNVKGKGSYCLYALTDLAVEYMVRYEKLHHGNLRSYLPSPRMVSHELEVTEVVRTLKNDAMVLAAKLILRDEQRLRSDRMVEVRATYGNLSPGDVFPDLYAHFVYKESGAAVTRHFAVEVDNTTIPADKVAAKVERIIALWKWPPVILCMVQSRIIDISRAVMARGGNSLGNLVLFGLLSDYCRSGIFKTKWQVATGEGTALIHVK